MQEVLRPNQSLVQPGDSSAKSPLFQHLPEVHAKALHSIIEDKYVPEYRINRSVRTRAEHLLVDFFSRHEQELHVTTLNCGNLLSSVGPEQRITRTCESRNPDRDAARGHQAKGRVLDPRLRSQHLQFSGGQANCAVRGVFRKAAAHSAGRQGRIRGAYFVQHDHPAPPDVTELLQQVLQALGTFEHQRQVGPIFAGTKLEEGRLASFHSGET